MPPSVRARRPAPTDPESATRDWLAKLQDEIADLRRNLDDPEPRPSRAEK